MRSAAGFGVFGLAPLRSHEERAVAPYDARAPFLHGWFWWPYSLRHRRGGYYVEHWTGQLLAHSRAMGARTL